MNAGAHAALQERAAALAASEQQLRTLYEALACGVLVWDISGRIVHANVAAQELRLCTTGNASAVSVQIPAFHRYLYLGGFTEAELAAYHDDKIREYEAHRPAWMPRIEID